MENFLVVAVIVVLVIIFLYKNHSVKVYRFHRPTCPYCVRSQSEWDHFKRKCKTKLIDCKDINLNDGSHESMALAAEFNIKSVPTIIAIKDDRVYEYKGNRSSNDLERWVCSL